MVIKKLKERIKSLSGNMKEDKIKKELEEIETINIELDHKVKKLIAENEHLKQTYKQLYDSIKSSHVVNDALTLHHIDPKLLKVDVAQLAPKLQNNRTAHSNYLKHTQEETATLREIVEKGRSLNPLNTPLDYAFKKTLKRKVWKPTRKVFTNIGYIWRPTGRTFTIVGNACPLTRITTPAEVPFRKPIALESNTTKPMVTLVYSQKFKASRNNVPIVQIVIWYLDSGCSKHMTGDRSQVTNFVDEFLGMVKFGNDHVAKIMGYGDYHIGNVTILKVYFVDGLGHNLFFVGQFCDSDLEVAFRQHTCFIRNIEGLDLLFGS
nr:integrase, catalytic region, zinc finger, CCHC-type, peptidase aspartic, catalytic [Tanacetum cinerariifolium]